MGTVRWFPTMPRPLLPPGIGGRSDPLCSCGRQWYVERGRPDEHGLHGNATPTCDIGRVGSGNIGAMASAPVPRSFIVFVVLGGFVSLAVGLAGSAILGIAAGLLVFAIGF